MLKPSSLLTLKSLCIFGFLISNPTSSVFLPDMAIITERFVATKVFPSPLMVDEIEIIFLPFSGNRY